MEASEKTPAATTPDASTTSTTTTQPQTSPPEASATPTTQPQNAPLPTLLPLNGIGPTPLNITPNGPPHAHAFLNPATVTPNDPKNPPKFHSIQPQDLKKPIPFHFSLPYIYDAATGEYWLFTTDGALQVHKTPRVVISKKEARTFLDKWPTRQEALTTIGDRFKIPKSKWPDAVLDELIIYNAVHDSIIVQRVKESTGLFAFYEDKRVKPQSVTMIHPNYFQWVRPSFANMSPHLCTSLYHCGNNIIYCAGCTSYIIPSGIKDGSLVFGQKVIYGRVAVPLRVASSLLMQCLQTGQSTIDFPRAYTRLSVLFNIQLLSIVPIPQSYMVLNLLRDSLLVVDDNGVERSWEAVFGISTGVPPGQGLPANDSNRDAVANGAKLVGAGVGVGVGIASLLLGF